MVSMADFIVCVRDDTLNLVLRGTLSPPEALMNGRLRYAGDERLGVAVLRELAVTTDAIFEPCREPGEDG